MSTFDAFRRAFGAPAAGTGRSPAGLGLAASGGLAGFVAEVGGGLFRDGLLSVCSIREGDGSLAEWNAHLPAGARLFATGAFGFLFAAAGDAVWVVDPQHGEVVESDIPLRDIFDVLAEPATRERFLRESLFEDWRELHGGTLGTCILCPSPAPALGGDWSLTSLQAMSLPVYLSFTAQLFGNTPAGQVEVRRL